ncbi:hypothetical protein F5Y19DRAFT_477672 [Xylariaceae sp. FL1651]|nr:hypothetical protein F5Y19DRAFT_477672 [Xylariaceae sp. FL1651]
MPSLPTLFPSRPLNAYFPSRKVSYCLPTVEPPIIYSSGLSDRDMARSRLSASNRTSPIKGIGCAMLAGVIIAIVVLVLSVHKQKTV